VAESNPQLARDFYYASTAGGFTISQWGWNGIKDTNGDWPNSSYEKVSASPWFYKAWYTKSAGQPETCDRETPYLTEKEMIDILNAWVVWKLAPTDTNYRSKILPININGNGRQCWDTLSPLATYSLYNIEEMHRRASDLARGTIYANIASNNHISSVGIGVTNGSTTSIVFQTNSGSFTVNNGEEFKTVFNLRAPGYISIKSRLFDIVRKDEPIDTDQK